MWLLQHFCINSFVLILTFNFRICRFWVYLMPCCIKYPHPLQMDYIYYKPNEQYCHLIGLAHSMAMLEHLNNTFIILIMKYLRITLRKKCNLIFLYNYIARFHERTPWCVNRFVYVGIANFWSSLVYGWVPHKMFLIAIPAYQPTHVHVPLP
jgi:hypothetical protein